MQRWRDSAFVQTVTGAFAVALGIVLAIGLTVCGLVGFAVISDGLAGWVTSW